MYMTIPDKNMENISDRNIFHSTMVELTWQEVQKAADMSSIVLFPIGVVEEHGPHLDLSPDIYASILMCKMIKAKLTTDGIPSIIAPPYYWGINKATGRFPGSFTVKPETFKALLHDSMECLKNWGFSRIFTLNFHGDSLHCSTIDSSLTDIRESLKIDAYNLMSLSRDLSLVPQPFRSDRTGKFKPDIHAGSIETGLMWTFYPEKVRTEVVDKLKPQGSFEDPLGYVGDPANYRLEDERDAYEKISSFYVQVIQTFLDKS